jgi:AcrR family transcriptional regulator
MNRPVRARPDPDEVRARILEVAEEYFRRVGHRKTSVADIASELGMSPANVYRFFPSRDAINESICQRVVSEIAEIAQSARNRPGSFQSSRLIFATYYNAGVRAYDIENPFQPREVGYYVPPDPTRMMDPRPNRPKVIQSCDCYVDRNGLMYLTDPNAGLYILQFEGI